jgi:polysaccharide export outer membrane protein
MISSMRIISFACIVLAASIGPHAIAQTLPPSNTTQGTATKAVAESVPVAVPDSYVIGPDDVLFIRVWGDAVLTGYYAVSPDGKITFPLIRDIQAAGLTREELTRQLTEALSKKLVNPDVTTQLTQINSKKYYISGEVNRQGSFPLTAPITVFDALNGAGGFKEFARKDKVVIARGAKRIKFNYQEVLKGKRLEQNIMLQNGDTIIVP